MENRRIKIVADSSADIHCYEGLPFASAPLKIVTAEREWVDDKNLNVEEMVETLLHYSGKSGSSCPSPADWTEAFEDYDEVFCVTITSNLSGSYNSACIAAEEYMGSYSGRRVHVFDSLSTGPEMHLVIDKIAELAKTGLSFDEICTGVNAYMQETGLLFVLESMQNLANNGRCSRLVAKAAGILNIRPLGKASDVGTLEMLEKPRGEKKAVAATYKTMVELGYKGGKVYIAHCMNPSAAEKLRDSILAGFPKASVEIYRCGGLCSFYAEKGGMLIGFEKI